MERYDDNYYDKRNPILFLGEKIDKQVTEQSSAATEQTSTASNEMAILGNNLLKLVQQFKV